MDSPGGDALASDLMWREIQILSKDKPVIASMSDTAASGAEPCGLQVLPLTALLRWQHIVRQLLGTRENRLAHCTSQQAAAH